MSLMPLIKSSVSKRRALLTASISLDREIISPYFCYAKKGLIYIIIIDFSSRQPSFYTKYTKLNTYMLYNMRSVSLNKYTFLYYTYYCTY